MAFSESYHIALFQILDVPYFAGHYTVDGMGGLTSLSDLSGATQGQAKTTILDFLTNNIETSAQLTTVLTIDLDRWLSIGSQVARIENGAVGSLQGVTYDFRHERTLIAERVRIIVPFYKYHEVIARKIGNGNGVNIATVRL